MTAQSKNSVDLEKIEYPNGNKNFWSVGDAIRERQDKTRNIIAIILILSWGITTIGLIILSILGKCGTNGINCNSLMYSSFSTLAGVIIGFYFNRSNLNS